MTLSASYFPILSVLIFFPLITAIILLFLRGEDEKLIKWSALVASLVEFLLSIPLFLGFIKGLSQLQFEEKYAWIPAFNINYHVGVDGLNLFLILLTTFLTPLALLASFESIKTRVKEFLVFVLILETGIIGFFSSVDLFLFYVFLEGLLIPMYFLIGIWGGERRVYATVKFVLFTLVGSLLMLAAIIYLWNVSLGHNLSYTDLYFMKIAPQVQLWLFLGFALSFAIKVPLFPFHTWLPDAHVEAPTLGSVFLAALLLKIGAYGFIRINVPLFPDVTQAFVPIMTVLAVIGILYGGVVAAVQPDIKKLVAYSSVSHLGFVVLGIFALNDVAATGAVLQMINHGLSTGALFLIVGMLYDRRHTRFLDQYGGIARVMPLFYVIFLIVAFSSMGLPGLNGFVGEVLILIGSYKTLPTMAILAAPGVLIAAVYLLNTIKKVMHGEIRIKENEKLRDISLREAWVLIPIVLVIFWIGIYPKPFLDRIAPSARAAIASASAAGSIDIREELIETFKSKKAKETSGQNEETRDPREEKLR